MTDPGRQLRISDSDRQIAADRLRAAQNEGRLPVAEYDDRLGKLYQAVTYGDLESLFYDLPRPFPPQPMMQQQPMHPMMMPPAMQAQPMTGPFAGPAAVVHNNIVVSGPMIQASSGAATAGMVFGILAICGFWIPFGDFLLSGLAILLSVIGLAQTSGNQLAGRGKAVTGLVLGIVGLLPAILFFTLVFAAVSSV
jgi:hypothetical protein